jgi:MFS transporter, DHA1 family, multidrug resistance protein
VEITRSIASRFSRRPARARAAPSDAGRAPSAGDDSGLGASVAISLAVGIGAMSFNFWYPFMPLYLLTIGATSEANAVFWVAVATTVQGIARLLTGPVWGILSDRMGRKLMLLRALYLATPTTLIAAFVGAPWQISIALAFQGLFSGFIPAAVALISVSVPESRLTARLGLITGAQYIGTTAGPAIGAVLALLFGFRGAILFAAFLPALAATLVLFVVPNDQPATRGRRLPVVAPLEPFRPTFQLVLAIFLFFLIFAMTQLVRLATPIALKAIEAENVNAMTGLAFTLAGFASAVSVLLVAPRFFRQGRQQVALISGCLLCGAAFVFLALADTVPQYVLFFVLISLLQAAMIPATNSLIAGNVPRSRRGTAFGWAGSAQAVAFVVGPMGAALFAAVSLQLGFIVLGGIFVLMALVLITLREPDPVAFAEQGQAASPGAR